MEFRQIPAEHKSGTGCPRCAKVGASDQDVELRGYVESLGFSVQANTRAIIPPKEIDIYIPEKHIGIEFDGVWCPSSRYKDKHYHMDKWRAAKAKGVRLIFIRDSDWKSSRPIVESIVAHALGKTSTKFFARKGIIRELSHQTWKDFADANHLQGACKTSKRYGLFIGGTLTCAMGVLERSNCNEMVRFVVRLGTHTIGGLSKLLKNYNKPLITYCENRLFSGEGYISAGFTKKDCSPPDLSYTKNSGVANRRGFQKKSLAKKYPEAFKKEGAEKEIFRRVGWLQLGYCGTTKYTWTPCNNL